jgi:hypothetical protein
MRRPRIGLALLMGGCAGSGLEPAALKASVETSSVAPPAAAAATARGEWQRAEQRALDEARRPLAAFLADHGADCSSAKLQEAVRGVTETAVALGTAMRPNYPATLEAGAAVLDVADGAKKRSCTRQAKQLYDFVLHNFAGLGYAQLRERATSGLKDLRAKGERPLGIGQS